MIGIISKKNQRDTVREFFQLFKTPWEFYKRGKSYEVVITTAYDVPDVKPELLIIYGTRQTDFDFLYGIGPKTGEHQKVIEYAESRLPIYRSLASLEGNGHHFLKIEGSNKWAGLKLQHEDTKVLRIGYDLFQEVNFLLSLGQPVEFASIPTMEIHISMLRNCILASGIPLAEIPPVPVGYDYIVCLTHDVDFAGIRRHRFDHSAVGFLYRSLIVTLFDFLRRRASFQKLLNNWKAVLLLPAVYAHLARDFWIQFEQYMEIEHGLPSTFFFIPFKKKAGETLSGKAPSKRQCKYDIADVKEYVQQLVSHGCEIGLHGIDAWLDPEKGREEFKRIRRVTGRMDIGVRMHWLYLGKNSMKYLDEAGFFYDSTLGYNDAVGYRAGTTQLFRPIEADRLLEIPLHVQDTALFYSGRMNLKEEDAFSLVCKLVGNAKKFGGILTFNWHHRSLGPERCWGNFYKKILEHLKIDRVWFVRAGDATRWFQKRRKISFEEASFGEKPAKIKVKGYEEKMKPGLVLRIFMPTVQLDKAFLKNRQTNYVDYPLDHGTSFIDLPQRC